VRVKQLVDLNLMNILSLLNNDKAKDFYRGAIGILRFRNRICVPKDEENRLCYLRVINANLFYIQI